MKKTISLLLVTIVLAIAMAACGTSTPTPTPISAVPVTPPAEAETPPAANATPDALQTEQAEQPPKQDAPIFVTSREEGSGTRGAFVELFEVQDADKKDMTTAEAEITNSTADIMTSVAGNPQAIGYISLGSLNETVKALKIDGADATAENIINGTYAISRPFNIVVKEGGAAAEAAQDFIDFILSEEGQAVAEGDGYIKLPDAAKKFEGGKATGKITVSGSSSVGNKLMPALIDAYNAINPSLTIDLQVNDSGTGIQNTVDGVCDIGMSSRELKDGETGLTSIKICTDGVAVIVNNGNTVDGLTKEQVKSIYLGETKNWSELS